VAISRRIVGMPNAEENASEDLKLDFASNTKDNHVTKETVPEAPREPGKHRFPRYICSPYFFVLEVNDVNYEHEFPLCFFLSFKFRTSDEKTPASESIYR
jgi:hypothetical protein